jgi:DNA-binding NtrC family response regulator
MTYLDKALAAHLAGFDMASRSPLVIVIEDDTRISDTFHAVCDCLDVMVQPLESCEDLAAILRESRPMAVVTELDMFNQDGCHVLKTVAAYDRNLPVMVLAGADAALLGAIDAVEELWELSSVSKSLDLPSVGQIVDFLFRAGQSGRCLQLMPV